MLPMPQFSKPGADITAALATWPVTGAEMLTIDGACSREERVRGSAHTWGDRRLAATAIVFVAGRRLELTLLLRDAELDETGPVIEMEALEREDISGGPAGALQTALARSLEAALAPAGPATEPPAGYSPAADTVATPKRRCSPLPTWRMKRTLAYFEAHLSERVSLADLAEAAGLTRMHFAAQFRALTGLRPHEYMLRRRIERAQELMRQTNDSLVAIALDVGFQTQAHFTTVFKRFVGETPHRWRCATAA